MPSECLPDSSLDESPVAGRDFDAPNFLSDACKTMDILQDHLDTLSNQFRSLQSRAESKDIDAEQQQQTAPTVPLPAASYMKGSFATAPAPTSATTPAPASSPAPPATTPATTPATAGHSLVPAASSAAAPILPVGSPSVVAASSAAPVISASHYPTSTPST